jgi:hypothetical protein
MSGLSGDGATLIDVALALGKTGTPIIAINNLASQTDRDEQTGFGLDPVGWTQGQAACAV